MWGIKSTTTAPNRKPNPPIAVVVCQLCDFVFEKIGREISGRIKPKYPATTGETLPVSLKKRHLSLKDPDCFEQSIAISESSVGGIENGLVSRENIAIVIDVHNELCEA